MCLLAPIAPADMGPSRGARAVCHHGQRRPLRAAPAFARACAAAGHEVRVAAPASYAAAVTRAGFPHEPFADAPPDLVGPVMASLPSLGFVEADELVVREVFARIDAQAGLPSVIETVERWRPDCCSASPPSSRRSPRRSAPAFPTCTCASGCTGRHPVRRRHRRAAGGLGRLAGLGDGRLPAAWPTRPSSARYQTSSTTRRATCHRRRKPFSVPRVHPATDSHDLPHWGDPDAPLVYVTFGSVTGSLPHLTGVYRRRWTCSRCRGARADHGRAEARARRPRPPAVERPCDPVVAPGRRSRPGRGDARHGGFGTTIGAWRPASPRSSRRCSRSTRSSTASTSLPWDRDRHREGPSAGRGAGSLFSRSRRTPRPLATSLPRCARCRRPRRPWQCSPAWSAQRHFASRTAPSVVRRRTGPPG